MFPFKRIFNFQPSFVTKLEQRHNARYAPGAGFPLRANLIVNNRESPVKVVNLSGKGLGLLLEGWNPPREGSAARVRLSIEDYEQLLDATLVHVRPEKTGSYCGVDLKFADFPTQKTYLQLIQPVAIGQSLTPVPADRVIQNEPQFVKRVFRSDEDAALTVWLEKDADLAIHSFEFQMHDYFCHVDGKSGLLEAYGREDASSHKGKLSNPIYDISGSLHAEIRQLFRWTLPNLSKQVPEDIRAFLQRFAT